MLETLKARAKNKRNTHIVLQSENFYLTTFLEHQE